MLPGARPFQQIVEEYQSRVYSTALRIVGDGGTAEEVAQDVFVELYRVIGDIVSEGHLTAWLRRVTVHRATDALRRRSRTLHGAAELQEWMVEASCYHDHGEPSVMEMLLRELSPAQRSVVLLRYQEDLLPGEIAETLKMPLATVKSHLQRALKLLRSKSERLGKESTRHG